MRGTSAIGPVSAWPVATIDTDSVNGTLTFCTANTPCAASTRNSRNAMATMSPNTHITIGIHGAR